MILGKLFHNYSNTVVSIVIVYQRDVWEGFWTARDRFYLHRRLLLLIYGQLFMRRLYCALSPCQEEMKIFLPLVGKDCIIP
jgi:hypothetical protein